MRRLQGIQRISATIIVSVKSALFCSMSECCGFISINILYNYIAYVLTINEGRCSCLLSCLSLSPRRGNSSYIRFQASPLIRNLLHLRDRIPCNTPLTTSDIPYTTEMNQHGPACDEHAHNCLAAQVSVLTSNLLIRLISNT